MLNLSHTTHRFRIPRDIECTLKPMLDRLLADNTDGASLIAAIRPHFGGERPRSEVIRGTTTRFYVEGPWYNVAELEFPLGGQLSFDHLGWLNLDPMQTSALRQRVREAVDDAIYRWAAAGNQLHHVSPCRRGRIRSLEDPLALRQMAAAAGCGPRESEADNA